MVNKHGSIAFSTNNQIATSGELFQWTRCGRNNGETGICITKFLAEIWIALFSTSASPGEEYQSPVSDILLHLSLHGTHHRGQMATYVSGKGAKPINTDYIQYCLSNRL
jgi:DinB family protein